MLAEVARDSVACLMVGSQAALLVGDDVALLLRAHHDLDGGFLDLLFGDGLLALTGGQQCSLVHEVLQISAGEASRGAGNRFQAHIGAEGLVLCMDAEQNLLAALDVGQTDVDLTVKAARAQQRLVQNVRAVRGSHDDDAIVGVEAVHLDQQLVQGLLALIVTAAETCAALTAHRVDLIDEDDGRHRLFGFSNRSRTREAPTPTYISTKIGTGNRVERHTGLTGTGTGQQRFCRYPEGRQAVRRAECVRPGS